MIIQYTVVGLEKVGTALATRESERELLTEKRFGGANIIRTDGELFRGVLRTFG